MWECVLFWGFTSWLYTIAGFILGIIKIPYHIVAGIIKDTKMGHKKGKEIEDRNKTKRS